MIYNKEKLLALGGVSTAASRNGNTSWKKPKRRKISR